MSVYTFLASDFPLKNVENTKIKKYSIDNFKNMPALIYVENENDFGELEIFSSEKMGTASGAHGYLSVENYTKKPYIATFTLAPTDERIEKFISYISNHLDSAEEVELWQIWADDEDDIPAETTKCKLVEFSKIHFEKFFNSGFRKSREHSHHFIYVPHCLIIEK